MQFVGRVFDGRSRFVPVYCSEVFATRAEAAAACFKARPKHKRCMVSEARYNGELKEIMPTHYGIQWVDRPKPRPAKWLTWLRPKLAGLLARKRLWAVETEAAVGAGAVGLKVHAGE